MMMKRWFSQIGWIVGTTALVLVAFNNCSQVAPLDSGSLDLKSMSDIGIMPDNQTIAPGASLKFRGIGGVPPYSFSAEGGGLISAGGLYTAPSLPSSDSLEVTVAVTDSVGFRAETTVRIFGSNSIVMGGASPSPAPTNSQVKLSASNGSPPYTFTLISGAGRLNGDVYTTPLLGETASFRVTDRLGISNTINLQVTGPTSVITNLAISPYGRHQVMGGTGGCPAGFSFAGKVADASGATSGKKIYGDQIFCTFNQIPTANSTVLSDLVMTTTTTCASGYSVIGKIENCTGTNGKCIGTFTFCAKYKLGSSAGPSISGFYVTPDGAYSATAPACEQGYTRVGVSGDCYLAKCSGFQSHCVRRQ